MASVVLFVLVVPTAPASAASSAATGAATERYLVVLDDALGAVTSAASDLLASVGAGRVLDTYQHALAGFLVELPPVVAPLLATLPGVASVEPDRLVRLTDTQADAPWGLDRVDQRTQPLSGTYTYDGTGDGVRVYVIDSGIRATHQQFGGRVSPGTTTNGDGSSTDDCLGHGTMVAGLVAGTTFGVAKDADLVTVRVFDCAETTPTSAVVAGIDWVVGHHQAGVPAVANLSLGGPASAAMDAAVRRLVSDGVTTVVAAGNESRNACTTSPARVSEALVAGATDIDDRRASFSNIGPCVDVHAPGVEVRTAHTSSDTTTAIATGTSFAAPHAAGTAALRLEDGPGASPAAVHDGIVAAATGNVVRNLPNACGGLQQLLGMCPPKTPNRLLFTGAGSAPPPPPPSPPSSCNALQRLLGLC